MKIYQKLLLSIYQHMTHFPRQFHRAYLLRYKLKFGGFLFYTKNIVDIYSYYCNFAFNNTRQAYVLRNSSNRRVTFFGEVYEL